MKFQLKPGDKVSVLISTNAQICPSLVNGTLLLSPRAGIIVDVPMRMYQDSEGVYHLTPVIPVDAARAKNP